MCVSSSQSFSSSKAETPGVIPLMKGVVILKRIARVCTSEDLRYSMKSILSHCEIPENLPQYY